VLETTGRKLLELKQKKNGLYRPNLHQLSDIIKKAVKDIEKFSRQ
jgi:hypothetical protein